MTDPFLPTVDVDVFEQLILSSGRIILDSKVKVGNTTSFVAIGNQALHKRFITVRELEPGQIGYEQATGLSIRFSFLGVLMTWFEINRNWKEGGFIVLQNNNN